MKRVRSKLFTFPALLVGTVLLVVVLFWVTTLANAIEGSSLDARVLPVIAPVPVPVTAPAVAKPVPMVVPVVTKSVSAPEVVLEYAGELDGKRQFALGMIETANDDYEIGLAGEVSRYQIMPSVWKRYSRSRRYHDPEVSLQVARQHWVSLSAFFKQQTKREPTDFDMYVLWNTRYGYYARKGFKPHQLNPVVRDRAQRFVNLVKRGTPDLLAHQSSVRNGEAGSQGLL